MPPVPSTGLIEGLEDCPRLFRVDCNSRKPQVTDKLRVVIGPSVPERASDCNDIFFLLCNTKPKEGIDLKPGSNHCSLSSVANRPQPPFLLAE